MGLYHPPSQRQGVPMVRADRYRATHQASVDAILGPNVRRVYSRGTKFMNLDRWPLRSFVIHFCAWISQNPGVKPTRDDLAAMCDKANKEPIPRPGPCIFIASTPDVLPLSVACALTGGVYHESWHTVYSRRRPLTVGEVEGIIDAMWDRVPSWQRLGQPLLEWSNIVDDIQIERNGCRDFPGSPPKLVDTTHFVLDREEESRRQAILQIRDALRLQGLVLSIEADGKDPQQVLASMTAEEVKQALDDVKVDEEEVEGIIRTKLNRTLSIVPRVFREVGKGYRTERVRNAMADYREWNPMAVAFVLEGPLKPLLLEAIGLPASDDMAPLRMAMDIIATIVEHSPDPPDEDDEDDDEKKSGGGGKGGRVRCPNCGSPNVRVRRTPDKGEKAGLLICGHCGYQEECKISDDGSGDGSVPEEGGDGDPKSDGDEDTAAEGDPADRDDRDGDPDEDDGPGHAGDEDDGDADEQTPHGAGGHHHDDGPSQPWDVVAGGYLEDAEDDEAGDAAMKDASGALQEAIQEIQDRAHEDAARYDEVPYHPYDRTEDVVEIVKPSAAGQAADEVRADKLLENVRASSAYLRARLRNIVRAVSQTGVEHGVRRGRGLSDRRFVEDYCELRMGVNPSRPDYDVDEEIDTSLAAVSVMDQSGSMSWDTKLQAATEGFMAVSDPLDALRYPNMAIGFRDGKRRVDIPEDTDTSLHFRLGSSHIDVFKTWYESFRNVRWRFANTRGTGGTPMADGIQFALDQLLERTETHRVIFVFTDGEANYNHRPVMRHQFRVAASAGIHVIGVGIGREAAYVTTMFPDHVYVPNISELGHALTVKLNEMLDFRGLRRGGPRPRGATLATLG